MLGKPVFAAIGVAAVLVAAAWCYCEWSTPFPETPSVLNTPRIEPAPPCPWREPEQDLRAFFPQADHYQTEERILSGQRLELADRLGRPPTAEENALSVHRVFHQQQSLGTVLTRRVKGEYGAIEVVLAISTNGRVCGLRLQRLREPEAIATELHRPEWLGAFQGKRVSSSWQIGLDVPAVSTPARASAEAVVDGVRSLLVLLDTANQSNVLVLPHH
jgi:hypothetical protein